MTTEQMDFYKHEYFELDKPIPYNQFMISPVTVKDYYKFFTNISCFMMKKNRDPIGIPMSEMQYLIHQIENHPEQGYFFMFAELMNMALGIDAGLICLRCGEKVSAEHIREEFKLVGNTQNNELINQIYEKNFKYCKKCKNLMSDRIAYFVDEKGKGCFQLDGNQLTTQDFNDIKQIVCYQNMLDYNDKYIDPNLEEDLKEEERMRNKNIESPSLEKQMCCIVAGSGYKIDELKELSIRKFTLLLKTIDQKLHYNIYKLNENSGAVKFPKGLDHWIYETKKSLADRIIPLDKFKKNMQHVAK